MICKWFLRFLDYDYLEFVPLLVLSPINPIFIDDFTKMGKAKEPLIELVSYSNRREFEYQNPVYQLSILYRQGIINIFHSTFKLINKNPSYSLAQKVNKKNDDNWQIQFRNLMNYHLPENLSSLFEAVKKKDQEKLLKSFILKNSDFMAFVAQAGDKHKYKWSRYITEFRPKDLEKKIYPEYFYKNEKDEFVVNGYTDLTEGQLKVALKNRRYTIADVLDNGETWLCFFRTMSGLSGNETPHVGEPHYHFISNAWGYTRNHVIEQLKSYTYSLKSLHIKFDRERSDEGYKTYDLY